MTRSQMRRQLYRGGGIASISRKNFGIGSKFQKFKDKTVERIRKIIPNELADVATKAAPFVAMIPGGAPYAAAMRGLGRLDQRGDLTDALKQGALTYGFGKYVAPHIREGVGSLYEGAKSKIGAWTGPTSPVSTAARTVGTSGVPGGGDPGMFYNAPQSTLNKILYGKEGGTGKIFGDKGLIGAGGKFGLGKSIGKGIPAVFAGSTAAAFVLQKALADVGPQEEGETMGEFMKRRKSKVSEYLEFYYKRTNPLASDQEVAQFVASNTGEYNQGGRVGLHNGGAGIEGLEDRLQTDAKSIIYEGDMRTRPMAKGGRIGYAGGTDKGPLYIDPESVTTRATPLTEFESDLRYEPQENRKKMYYKMLELLHGMSDEEKKEFLHGVRFDQYVPSKERALEFTNDPVSEEFYETGEHYNKGGRIGYRFGPGPVMEQAGLAGIPGIPQMAEDGMEYDMSQNGGFQPLGAKEGKDDVKANLAKNEFVFTADAVRGAGGGDIELGAQKMYDTMKKLEGRVA